MSITFYAGSGSTPSWKVWLSLEHKQIAYQIKMLSFASGDLKTPAFLALNPRGRVPTLVDGDAAIWESTAIVEYLEDRYPERPLLPHDPGERARVRRIAMEADFELDAAMDEMARATFRAPGGVRDPALLERGRTAAVALIARFEEDVRGPFFAGAEPGMADYTVYPILAMIRRTASRFEAGAVSFGPRLAALVERIEALPYFERTYPPHWRS